MNYWITLFFASISLSAWSQLPPEEFYINHTDNFGPSNKESNAISGEILLQLSADGSIEGLIKNIQTQFPTSSIYVVDELSDIAHIWHIRYNSLAVIDPLMLKAVRNDRNVQQAQFNHYVHLRNTEPNDPQYAQQWQYDNDGSNGGLADADIDAPEAWDISTGGISAAGDTIVVAIVDDGTNLNHLDLQGNLWKNYAEIPGNGIDDDNNGYIDDFDGWNAVNNNGSITGGSHGTCVSGIVGARGDNGIGVAGVNWNVKLMIIRGSSGTEATVVSAYNYALKMRKLYNASNGSAGAFVVASNSSFGVDNGNPANYPLWCALYDSMGVAGILNAGATANANFNIDVVGDIPTACSSDYLITVTNVGRNDQKVNSAGYGATTIDLGSFGEDTWTLTQTGYGAFGGTSGATPHVAGTIALMYSVPCPDFIQFAKTNPGDAALQVKEWIMQSADPNASLAGITVSGKRLNTFHAVSEVLNNCGPCSLPGGVKALNPSLHGVQIQWNMTTSATSYLLEYRETGSSNWQQETMGSTPFALGNLNPCTQYQYRIRSICNADSSTGYTNIFSFKTDGCCEAPIASSLSNLAEQSVDISWQAVTIAQGYILRYRVVGSSNWIESNTLPTNSFTLANLEVCANYEYQLASICSTGTTAYSDSYTFKTKGCGACEEQSYCSTQGSSDFLYIDEVALGAINNNTGDNSGYAAFIDGNYAWLMADSASSISLNPAFPVFAVTANWSIWIDWNQNGIFESGEIVLSQSGSSAITGSIIPPVDADTGITRMRIAVAAFQSAGECGDVGFGEIEDYCVRIKPRSFASIGSQKTENKIHIYPNPASEQFTVQLNGLECERIDILDISGKTVRSYSFGSVIDQMQVSTESLSNGVYFIRVSAGKKSSVHKIFVTKK